MTKRILLVPLLATLVTAAVMSASAWQLSAQSISRGWLALGDSYASGEGIPGTPAREAEGSGLATQGRDCRRANGEGTGATAWSVRAYRESATRSSFGTIALVACTGAVSSEVAAQIGEARAQFARNRWDVVTIGIGGNDIRFAEVLKGCLDINSVWGLFDLSPGCDISEGELKSRVDGLRATLAGVYDTVAGVVVPGGDVIVVGYPQIVEEVARWDRWRRTVTRSCEGIRRDDVGMIRSVTGYLNQQIALAVQEADRRHRGAGIRFHFLDISADPYEYSSKATDRHALCSQHPWLNGVTFGITSGDWWELARSFHPKQVGHDNTGRVLAEFIKGNVKFNDIPKLNIAELRSAPVPSLCEHPPGTLVDGSLPGIPADEGEVSLDLTGDRPPVIADLDGDGVDEAIVVADCNAGGVGWPNSLLLYGPGPTLLDEFQLGELVTGALPDYVEDRSGVRFLEARGGRVHVKWIAHRSADYGAGGSLPVDLVLDVEDGELTVIRVTRRDEVDALEGIIQAANSGDRSALAAYSLDEQAAENVILAVRNGGPFVSYECRGPLDSLDTPWVRDDVTRSCQLNRADGSHAWAHFLYDYHSTWTLQYFEA